MTGELNSIRSRTSVEVVSGEGGCWVEDDTGGTIGEKLIRGDMGLVG